MLGLRRVRHITIIATGYAANKALYYDVLGFTLVSEAYRGERDSQRNDLASDGQYVIELFSFPFPPCHPSRPEACSLRHLAFSVKDVERSIAHLETHRVKCESIHVGPLIGKCFTSFNDPDGLPLELYKM